MEESKRQLMSEGRAAEKRGDLKSAGDAYARAGAHEDAARSYFAGGFFVEAGKSLLQLSGYVAGRSASADGGRRNLMLKAAICFSRGGDVARAVDLYVACGEKHRGVELLRSLGDMANAARLEADRTGHVELLGYARPDKAQPEEELRAARRLEATGKREAALEAYAGLQQWQDAARLARVLGKLERAAEYFDAAAMCFEAAECHFAVRRRDEGLACLYRVTPTHPRYREACVMAIGACADRSTLTFDLEQLVTKFLATKPATDKEAEAFYAMGLLFEGARSFDSAADCYRHLLAARPGYRDAADRLRAAADEEQGASSKDFQRIVAEEQGFREAIKRHATPIANPIVTPELRAGPIATDSVPDVPPLDDLPELPSLPSLPALPGGKRLQAAAPAPAAAAAPAPVVEVGPPKEGMVINGRYRLEKKIGQGGMGAVYKARDLELGEDVAIKFLAVGMVDEEIIGRFRQEVSLSRQFSHPNIIRMYDIGSYGDSKFMTMEYLEGEDLGSIVRPGALPIDKGIALLMQAANALAVVHDHGVVHRDVKPDNFFLTKDGVLKVMDFGIAKRQATNTGLTRANVTAGTPQYLAPEQASNFGGVTHLADIYALGCIAYKMFTGQVPFDGEDVMPILLAHLTEPPKPPRQWNPQIPADLETIILQLLAKRPEQRLQSCRDLSALLGSMIKQGHARRA
ncbi:MAG: serine/threonine protein kinase [Deltaproteobacteria bacterium]|nr:serine/threonine protein kinase [Deltaproteobacteria bacterium]